MTGNQKYDDNCQIIKDGGLGEWIVTDMVLWEDLARRLESHDCDLALSVEHGDVFMLLCIRYAFEHITPVPVLLSHHYEGGWIVHIGINGWRKVFRTREELRLQFMRWYGLVGIDMADLGYWARHEGDSASSDSDAEYDHLLSLRYQP
jgi:hypothetical protein